MGGPWAVARLGFGAPGGTQQPDLRVCGGQVAHRPLRCPPTSGCSGVGLPPGGADRHARRNHRPAAPRPDVGPDAGAQRSGASRGPGWDGRRLAPAHAGPGPAFPRRPFTLPGGRTAVAGGGGPQGRCPTGAPPGHPARRAHLSRSFHRSGRRRDPSGSPAGVRPPTAGGRCRRAHPDPPRPGAGAAPRDAGPPAQHAWPQPTGPTRLIPVRSTRLRAGRRAAGGGAAVLLHRPVVVSAVRSTFSSFCNRPSFLPGPEPWHAAGRAGSRR